MDSRETHIIKKILINDYFSISRTVVLIMLYIQ